jgi:integrase
MREVYCSTIGHDIASRASHLLPTRAPPVKLTTQTIADLAPPPGISDAFFWDDAIPGFGIRVRASGRKLWIFQYRAGGRQQRRMTIGLVSAIGVGEARKMATQLYAKTKPGLDPAGDKLENQARVAETFKAAADLFLARQKTRLRPLSYAPIARHLLVNAKPLHRLPLANVDRRAAAALLTKTATDVSGATTNRLRASLSSFFAWGIREGLIENNPIIGTEERDEKSRDRLLTDGEVAEIWNALQDDAYGAIVRLLILTGARRAEIGALQWSEVDLDRGLISLPGSRTKNGRPHVIVLSAPAIDILRARPADREFVLGRGWNGFHAWANSKTALDQRMLEARQATDGDSAKPMPAWVLHDFRRYLSTTMHERLAIPPHIVEAVLGHVGHQAGVAGRYNKSLYIAEKGQAMTRWAEHLMAIVEGRTSNVVPLRTQ